MFEKSARSSVGNNGRDTQYTRGYSNTKITGQAVVHRDTFSFALAYGFITALYSCWFQRVIE